MFSCNRNKKTKIEHDNQIEIKSEHTNNKLLQYAIDNYRMKEYFDDFQKKGQKLYVIENEHFDKQKELKWNNSILEVATYKLVENKDDMDYIIFTRVDIRKDSAFIDYYFSYAYINSENIFSFEEADGWKLVSSRISIN